MEEVDAAYMKTCLYHKVLHPLCPVFKLGYVVQESGQSFSALAEKVWCPASEGGWVLGSSGSMKAFQSQTMLPSSPSGVV